MTDRIVDVGALRLRVLKETWEHLLRKQPDGSWRGPVTRVIRDVEVISCDPTKGQSAHVSDWTTDDIYGSLIDDA